MRKGVAIALIAIGLALVVGLLLAPNSDIVRLPTPTDGAEIAPTPTRVPDTDDRGPIGPATDDAGDARDVDDIGEPTAAPTHDPVGDHDCGPECYEEHKPPRPSKTERAREG